VPFYEYVIEIAAASEPPDRPTPYRTKIRRARPVSRNFHAGQRLAGVATERVPNPQSAVIAAESFIERFLCCGAIFERPWRIPNRGAGWMASSEVGGIVVTFAGHGNREPNRPA